MFENSVTPEIEARVQELIEVNPSTMPIHMTNQLSNQE